jgi:hypothetical protein
MPKHIKRWPIWKIGLSAVGWAALGVILIVLARLADAAVDKAQRGSTGQTPVMSLSTVMMGLGAAGFVLSIITLIWMGLRIHDSRIPPWERGKRRKRR